MTYIKFQKRSSFIHIDYNSGRCPGGAATEAQKKRSPSGLKQKSCCTKWCSSSSISAVCGFTCFDSVKDREAFLFCEDMLAFGGFAWAIRWDFDHAWNRAVWFIGFCGRLGGCGRGRGAGFRRSSALTGVSVTGMGRRFRSAVLCTRGSRACGGFAVVLISRLF